MKRKDIHHFFDQWRYQGQRDRTIQSHVEKRMYRYFTAKNTLSFLPVLKDLVTGYNCSYHQRIKMAPVKVTVCNGEQVWKNLYAQRLNAKRILPKLKVGDRVRLNKKFRQFKKGYLPSWTEEVFVVGQVMSGVVPTYKTNEWDGTPVEGTFYAEDL